MRNSVIYRVLCGRQSLTEHLAATRGGDWAPEEVCVCHSAKHALSGTLLSLVQEGDEVLVPVPAWASYFDQVRLTGARPIEVARIFMLQGGVIGVVGTLSGLSFGWK